MLPVTEYSISIMLPVTEYSIRIVLPVTERPAGGGHLGAGPGAVRAQTLVAPRHLHSDGGQHQHLGGGGEWTLKNDVWRCGGWRDLPSAFCLSLQNGSF